jgi:hypothetical protein
MIPETRFDSAGDRFGSLIAVALAVDSRPVGTARVGLHIWTGPCYQRGDGSARREIGDPTRLSCKFPINVTVPLEVLDKQPT